MLSVNKCSTELMEMRTSLKLLYILSLAIIAVLGNYTSEYRLPSDIQPTSYVLNVMINDVRASHFNGLVEIGFVYKADPTYHILLHTSTKYIEIESVLLRLPGEVITCTNGTLDDPKTDIVRIICGERFQKYSNYELVLRYKAKFTTEDMEGFYKSSYIEDDTQHTLLATQFQPSYARRVFPCLDEPSFKAKFNITITHPTNYAVLSNMPVSTKSASKDGLRMVTTFDQTPEISTYLVSFIISEFESQKPETTDESFDYQVFARKSAKDNMAIANQYGSKLIKTMGNWIGIEYAELGNTQAYQVAVPDLVADAMENWGLITYREVDLLDEGMNTSNVAKQRIITVIARELSHQWFGDYVTMDWWSDLWLNKGFATYFEYHIPSKVLDFEEDFELENQFISVFQQALKADSDIKSHPLSVTENEINTLAEINQWFDDISYAKGGSIVRMMSYIFGPEQFKAGLKSYLEECEYSNTSPSQLLDHLQAASPDTPNVKDKLSTWIYQPGFPLVTANLSSGGDILLKQEPFMESEDQTLWDVPLTYTTSSEQDFRVTNVEWFRENATVNITQDSWIIFNLQAMGFYRVNYDDILWNRIIEGLIGDEMEKIHVLNRAQLIDDIYNIAKLGKVPYETAFKLTEYLRNEKEYYPWQSALTAFSFLLDKINEENKIILKIMIRSYIENAFPKSTDSFKGHVGIIKKALIMEWSCMLGIEEFLTEVQNDYKNYQIDPSKADKNTRDVVLCYGLKHSETKKKDFVFLYDIFETSTSSIEKTSILTALGCTDDEELLTKYLNKIIQPNSVIRKQDVTTVLVSVYSKSDKGLETALDFLKNNFKKIESICKGLHSITKIITGLAKVVKTEKQQEQLMNIIDKNQENEEIQLISERVHNTMNENLEWINENNDKIKEVLLKYISSASGLIPSAVISMVLIAPIATMVINLV